MGLSLWALHIIHSGTLFWPLIIKHSRTSLHWKVPTRTSWAALNLNIPDLLQNVQVSTVNILKSHGIVPIASHSWIPSIMSRTPSTERPDPPHHLNNAELHLNVSAVRKSPVLRGSEWCHGWGGDRKRCRKPIKNTNIAGGGREQ